MDWMVRFGGEEFVVFMPETDLQFAAEVAERLANEIREHAFKQEGLELLLTCSFGVAQYRRGESMESLLQRADTKLYLAKAEGRDRVCVDV